MSHLHSKGTKPAPFKLRRLMWTSTSPLKRTLLMTIIMVKTIMGGKCALICAILN